MNDLERRCLIKFAYHVEMGISETVRYRKHVFDTFICRMIEVEESFRELFRSLKEESR